MTLADYIASSPNVVGILLAWLAVVTWMVWTRTAKGPKS